MKFLFWNIQKKQLIKEVVELIGESKCDICAFCEISDNTYDQIIITLKEAGVECSACPTPGCERIKIIIIGNLNQITLLNQHKYYSLIKIHKENTELIVGFVHFPSKREHTLDELRRAAELLSNQVDTEEQRHFTSNSMLMGDFNVDPFEMPMISFSGISATNGWECSRRTKVTRGGEKTKLFYNPMWTLYSCYQERPGSHKYIRSGDDVVSWHFLDQVIIRPTLIDDFKFESLKLIHGTKSYNYLNRNNAPKLSDHLPLICEIEF